MSPIEDRLFHRTLVEEWPLISHGEGVYLFDTAGKRYLDACAGVHVVSIGHGVREVVEVMFEQAARVCFTYSRFLTQPQLDLADRIAAMTPPGLSRVFFVSGGSEATESAMKMARKYHVAKGNPQKHKVVSRWQSWHGNTIGALSMSGRSPWRRDYSPYLLDFPHTSRRPIPIAARCAESTPSASCTAPTSSNGSSGRRAASASPPSSPSPFSAPPPPG